MNMHQIKRAVFLGVFCVFSVSMGEAFIGCAPRGETKSVDELLVLARDRFSEVKSAMGESALSADVGGTLNVTVQALEDLLKAHVRTDQATRARTIESGLAALLPKAGYTQRASLYEVQKQFGDLAANLPRAASNEAASLKLAATHAYTILASELESTKFGM